MTGPVSPGDFDPDRLGPDLSKGRRAELKVFNRLIGSWWVSWLLVLLGVTTLAAIGSVAQGGGGFSRGIFLAIVGGLTLLVAGVALMMLRYSQPVEADYLVVEPGTLKACRGGDIDVSVTIAQRDRVRGSLEVGLVCTEFYDTRQGYGETSRRVTMSAVAFEEWVPVDHDQPQQTVKLKVPAAAPFSYQGYCLSFVWQVSARDRRIMRRDPASGCILWVAP